MKFWLQFFIKKMDKEKFTDKLSLALQKVVSLMADQIEEPEGVYKFCQFAQGKYYTDRFNR